MGAPGKTRIIRIALEACATKLCDCFRGIEDFSSIGFKAALKRIFVVIISFQFRI